MKCELIYEKFFFTSFYLGGFLCLSNLPFPPFISSMCWLLQEMAENASNVFNSHVPEFVDAIWVALRDPALPVREQAVEALRACLCVIEKHETRWRAHWSVLTSKMYHVYSYIVLILPVVVVTSLVQS